MWGIPLASVVVALALLVAVLIYVVIKMAAQLDAMQERLDYACLKASQLSSRADLEDRRRTEVERPHWEPPAPA